jgi:5-methylcytosine-specific restriction endonuclease McrA
VKRSRISPVSQARRARSGVPGKLGITRLYGEAMTALRRFVFNRDKWICQKCGAPCSWASGHLAHIVSRGAGGSDTPENMRLLCSDCHTGNRSEHNCGGKPLPRRPDAEET